MNFFTSDLKRLTESFNQRLSEKDEYIKFLNDEIVRLHANNNLLLEKLGMPISYSPGPAIPSSIIPDKKEDDFSIVRGVETPSQIKSRLELQSFEEFIREQKEEEKVN